MQSNLIKDRMLNKKERQVTLQFYREENKKISLKNLMHLLEKVEEKGRKNYKNYDITLIRVLNGDKYSSYYMDDMYDIENYYAGKVKETGKFLEYSQVQITQVFSEKK